MFVAREKELGILERELSKDASSVLVYGKRKVGKTTLILEAARRYSSREVFYYECVKDTVANNVRAIEAELKRLGLMPAQFAFGEYTFEAVFSFLGGLGKGLVVVIDEYCYLKEYEDSRKVDSTFQRIIDNQLGHINLFLSGSHVSMMKDLLKERNALFGRFTCALELRELDYLDSSRFYEGLPPYDKAAFYAVFGGSPYILRNIDVSLPLEGNIKKLLLEKSSPVFLYVDSLLFTDLNNKASVDRVLGALKNGRKHYKELEEELERERTGNLSKMLKPLLEVGLVKKEYPINKMGQDKKATYQIDDNIVRFYYAYVFPRKYLLDRLDADDFYDEFIEPSLTEFVSLRFEEMCRDFIWLLANRKRLRGVRNVGSYRYDDSANRRNGEFDLAIERKDSYDIIEVKYLRDRVSAQAVRKELGQIKGITEINVGKTGFISVNGFDDDVPSLDYRFDGRDVYFED